MLFKAAKQTFRAVSGTGVGRKSPQFPSQRETESEGDRDRDTERSQMGNTPLRFPVISEINFCIGLPAREPLTRKELLLRMPERAARSRALAPDIFSLLRFLASPPPIA